MFASCTGGVWGVDGSGGSEPSSFCQLGAQRASSLEQAPVPLRSW